MLSDISLVFSHFMVNPNYYTSFMFGYKRQDLFNEISNMKLNKDKKENKDNKKDNDIFNDKNKNEIKEIKTKNGDSQTPPIESKFMKQFKEQQQSQTQNDNKEKKEEKDKIPVNEIKEENKILINSNKDKIENNNEINNNIKINNNKEEKIEDKKEIKTQKEQDKIIEQKEIDKNEIIDNEKDKDKSKEKTEDKNNVKSQNEIIRENINEEAPQPYQRHNSVPSLTESREGSNSSNSQRQRHGEEEEILLNQIVTNLGYDLSFSSIELPFIQRIVYSYTIADRIISPFSPFYQIFSNKKLFPRVHLQVPNILSSGEVMMMTGYSPFPEQNFDVYIRTIAVSPNNNENNNNSNNNNNNSNNNSNNNNSNNTNNNNSNNNNNNNT